MVKDKFNLDNLEKCKPEMGVDDVLLAFTHHWLRDKSLFPIEDNRLDLLARMLSGVQQLVGQRN